MTEYGEFRRWSRQRVEALAAQPGQEERLRGFLKELQLLNDDLLEVCDALAELGSASSWSLLRALRQYARLLPDPLRHVRARMRTIRARG